VVLVSLNSAVVKSGPLVSNRATPLFSVCMGCPQPPVLRPLEGAGQGFIWRILPMRIYEVDTSLLRSTYHNDTRTVPVISSAPQPGAGGQTNFSFSLFFCSHPSLPGLLCYVAR